MIPFLYMLAAMFDFRGPPFWICVAVFTSNLIMYPLASYAVWNQSGDFNCLLTNDRIFCECPDNTMGASFDLPLNHLLEIREDFRMQGGPQYFLVCKNGAEYPLSNNFGNPAWKFVEAIQEICPSVRIVPNQRNE
ncbi:MAG TPA: hypothetical protein DDW52_06290 [Planctomycetaceae bacterium]|nr:hypothetical protein [Planctomycetaceae bacterium]